MSKRPATVVSKSTSSAVGTTNPNKIMKKAKRAKQKSSAGAVSGCASTSNLDDSDVYLSRKNSGAESTESKEKFTFFYKKDSPFSQFYSCSFTKDGITYNCAEQYMMHQKAVLFGDVAMQKAILASTVPLEQKRFGRKVQNFVVSVWNEKCREIVFDGSYLKFTQNDDLLTCLTATDGTTLVEASPRDKIWGIGMGASNPLALNRKTWKGRNYLGEAITQVRERIKSEQSK